MIVLESYLETFFQNYALLTNHLGVKGVIRGDYLKIAPFIVNWYFSIPRIAQHVWILAVLGSLWSNGWYQPIILTYMILFINICQQNNHNPYDRLRGLWKPSFVYYYIPFYEYFYGQIMSRSIDPVILYRLTGLHPEEQVDF